MLLAVASGNAFLSPEGTDFAGPEELSIGPVNPELSLNAKLLFHSQGGGPQVKQGGTTTLGGMSVMNDPRLSG